MSYEIEALRTLPEEELVRLYNAQAKYTEVGIDYYAEELDRRSRERATQANIELSRESQKLARNSHTLTIANTVMSGVAIVIALIALFIGR
jgi:hypothetical protein